MPELTVGSANELTRKLWVSGILSRIEAGSRLLDAGAGECQYKPNCAHLVYVSQDFSKYDGKGDDTALQTGRWDTSQIDIVGDITAIPQESGSFDAILCTEVLEHLPAPIAALEEFARLLRPGGQLILTAPFCSLTHFAPFHFSSGFNRYFYEYHLERLGFEIVELTENGNFFEYLAQEIRRLPSILAKYASLQLGNDEILALNRTLNYLQEASARDAGSKELLCFGYHVDARRK